MLGLRITNFWFQASKSGFSRSPSTYLLNLDVIQTILTSPRSVPSNGLGLRAAYLGGFRDYVGRSGGRHRLAARTEGGFEEVRRETPADLGAGGLSGEEKNILKYNYHHDKCNIFLKGGREDLRLGTYSSFTEVP